jgi:acyl-CoA thioester hydrolase
MNKNFSTSYRIYYEDTDASGVVYYANYLKFFERARTDFLRACGISQFTLAQTQSIIFMVRKCQIEYKNSARLDDLIEIKTTVKKFGGASIVMLQEMFRKDDAKLLNILEVEIACVNSKLMKPAKIPEAIKSAFTNEFNG